jgi:hypothetical protein
MFLKTRVTRRLGKNCPNFGKSGQNSHQAKNVSNININAKLESPKPIQQAAIEFLKYPQKTTH